MESQKLNTWVQFLTSLAIILGLGLVVYELRQTKVLVRTELASEYNASWDERRFTIMGEDPASVIEKACTKPDSLTIRDIVVYQDYLSDLWGRAWRLWHLEGIAELGINWEEEARFNIRNTLGSAHGRWYARNLARNVWGDELANIGDEFLEAGNYNDCGDELERFLRLEE